MIYWHRYDSNCYISKGSTSKNATRKTENTSHPEFPNRSPKQKKVERLKENAKGKSRQCTGKCFCKRQTGLVNS